VDKDTVRRLWSNVKGDWHAWNARFLTEEPIIPRALPVRTEAKSLLGLVAGGAGRRVDPFFLNRGVQTATEITIRDTIQEGALHDGSPPVTTG
jgi:hypothetical protein